MLFRSVIAEAAISGTLRECLLPLDAGLESIPATEVGEAGRELLRDGALVPKELCEAAPLRRVGDVVRMTYDGVLVALGRHTEAGIQPERVFIPSHAEANTSGS